MNLILIRRILLVIIFFLNAELDRVLKWVELKQKNKLSNPEIILTKL